MGMLSMCESSETNESKLREMKMRNLLTERKDKTKMLFSAQQILQFTSSLINLVLFLDTQVSLAPTHVSLSVRWSVRKSYFQISIISASLVAPHEKLKG